MLTREKMSSRSDDKEFMATLAKGLAVLGCFGKERPTMTLSEAAVAASVSRATARRILRTLAGFRSRPTSCSSASPISPPRAGSTAPLR
jgi:hypothetical protein